MSTFKLLKEDAIQFNRGASDVFQNSFYRISLDLLFKRVKSKSTMKKVNK